MPALYVLDAIVKREKAKNGNKFGLRFGKNLIATVRNANKSPDYDKIAKVVRLWKVNEIFDESLCNNILAEFDLIEEPDLNTGQAPNLQPFDALEREETAILEPFNVLHNELNVELDEHIADAVPDLNAIIDAPNAKLPLDQLAEALTDNQRIMLEAADQLKEGIRMNHIGLVNNAMEVLNEQQTIFEAALGFGISDSEEGDDGQC